MANRDLRIVWHWQAIGPYHFARLRALAQLPRIDLTVVVSAADDDHEWGKPESSAGLSVLTLSTDALSPRVLKDTRSGLAKLLSELRPDVVVAAGYSETFSLPIVLAYRDASPGRIAVLWSESTAVDRPRKRHRERIKSMLVTAFDGALAAGSSHASYLRQLGMPSAAVRVVGNCVDNDFFLSRSAIVRQETMGEAIPNFFLFVGRMLPEKNLSGLIDAYRLYREQSVSPWDLVLVGSGSEEASLRKQVRETGLDGVWFEGLQQIERLPHYYGRAKCFVLPSVSEPWGLVVNEAMASGIPVLVSNRCGCATDLVRDGVNGFVFDPADKHHLARLMQRISGGSLPLAKLGQAGRDIISGFTPALFAEGVAEHLWWLYQRRKPNRKVPAATRLALRGADLLNRFASREPT